MKSEKMLELAVEALEDKKALDLEIIDISSISPLADYFVIASGSNKNQIQAMADEVDQKLTRNGCKTHQTEGYQAGEWVLLDYKDIVVHIFDYHARMEYDLEGVWEAGREVYLSDIRKAN